MNHNLLAPLLTMLLFYTHLSYSEVNPLPDIKKIKTIFEGMYSKNDLDGIIVSKTPVTKLFEVTIGTQQFYIDSTSRYLIVGEMYDLEKKTKLISKQIQKSVIQKLSSFGFENMLQYGPPENKQRVFIFTDYTCGYCKKFHKQISSVVALGITVNYILFSREGANSNSAQHMSNILCVTKSERNVIFDNLINNNTIPVISCKNDFLLKSETLGREIQLSGTPMIITGNGSVIGGFLTPEELKDRLKLEN
ncbi:MAG: DsbC family protein [Methylacidiphilales bacterium]|nr:DsbC family protein [Candidatus Methylacidiphilales bacterium]